MSAILAVDPGNRESGYVLWDGTLQSKGIIENERLLELVRNPVVCKVLSAAGHDVCLAIEMVAHYGTGMPCGKEVFETCLMIGRLLEAWRIPAADHLFTSRLCYRTAIKTHLCGTPRAKDGNVRQSIIDRLGPPGTKKAPNPRTYGLSGHLWQAMAVALFAQEVPA